jgi:hypothetical protein
MIDVPSHEPTIRRLSLDSDRVLFHGLYRHRYVPACATIKNNPNPLLTTHVCELIILFGSKHIGVSWLLAS